MDPDTMPLYEILGMTHDELVSMSMDFIAMAAEAEDLFELCKIIVDKYGSEAVFMSMSMFRILEAVKSHKLGSILKPDKETIDACISSLKATMSDN